MKAKFKVIGVTVNEAQADEIYEKEGKKFRRMIKQKIGQVRFERINDAARPLFYSGNFELTGDLATDTEFMKVGDVVEVEILKIDFKIPETPDERVG